MCSSTFESKPPQLPTTTRIKLPSISELTSASRLRHYTSRQSFELPQPSTPVNYALNKSSFSSSSSTGSNSSSGSAASVTGTSSGATTPLMRASPSAPFFDVHHHNGGGGAGGAGSSQMPAAVMHHHIPQYQYVPFQHKQAGTQVPVPVNYGQNFYQPIYYTIQRPPPTPPHPQYSVPEVINKPTNKCHRCGTTETPEWRRGPNGVRTLCNACGLFHAKLVKRKGAALAAAEVLNNKVCKGKNGRRIAIKKQPLDMKSESALGSPTSTAFPPPPPLAVGYDHSYTTAASHI